MQFSVYLGYRGAQITLKISFHRNSAISANSRLPYQSNSRQFVNCTDCTAICSEFHTSGNEKLEKLELSRIRHGHPPERGPGAFSCTDRGPRMRNAERQTVLQDLVGNQSGLSSPTPATFLRTFSSASTSGLQLIPPPRRPGGAAAIFPSRSVASREARKNPLRSPREWSAEPNGSGMLRRNEDKLILISI